MSPLPLRTALLSLGLLALSACDSTDDGGDAGGAACEAAGLRATGSLTASADGRAYTAACVSGQFTSGVLSVAGIENIDGSAGASQRQINVTVPSAAVGTFQVGTGGAIATYADVDLANPAAGTYASTSGTVTVAAVSATAARGSFSFAARNNAGETVQVSGGEFDVTF